MQTRRFLLKVEIVEVCIVVLHLLEQMYKAAADFEFLRQAFDLDKMAPAQVAYYAGNGLGIHQGGSVDLPEQSRVQLVSQIAYWFAYQGFICGSLYPGIFFIGLEEQDFFNRYQT